jgi:hypothetical protein
MRYSQPILALNGSVPMNAVLAYTIKFVADMDAAVDFHSRQLGLRYPDGSEFSVSGNAG